MNATKGRNHPDITVWPNNSHDTRGIYPKLGVRTTTMDARDILVIYKNPKSDSYSNIYDRMG